MRHLDCIYEYFQSDAQRIIIILGRILKFKYQCK